VYFGQTIGNQISAKMKIFMAFLLSCTILIDGKYEFNFAHHIEIVSSWQDLGDKCTIQLPSRGVLTKEGTTQSSEEFSFEKRFKTGMTVQVLLGYDERDEELEFSGYIKEIKPKQPFELVCEDDIYQLKRQAPISKMYSGTLKGLLKTYFPTANLSAKIPDILLSNFKIDKATPAEILQKIKDAYGLSAYFREDRTLFVGLPYTEFDTYEPVKYHFQRNVISNDLTYRRAEDVRIKVKVISMLKDNTKVEIDDVGDKDGETRTLHTYGETDKAKLKAWGESQLSRLKYEGYSGSIETFGLPRVIHSDAVQLYDERYKERQGQVYLVDKVTTTWGVNGFRRKVELGKKA
jgi:hypothetical protein